MNGLDEDRLRARLKQVGLRSTQSRLAVLDLLASGGPRSHSDVVDALTDGGWDRATLFRNLNDLAAAGLVRRFDLGDHVWRFEGVDDHGHDDDHHAHFVCTDCGEVKCLDEVEVTATGKAAALLERSVQVQIRGTCDNCV